VPPGNGRRSEEITRPLARNVAERARIPELLGKQESLMNSNNCANRDKKKKQATISRLSVLVFEST
jgi:hypothetical protein